MTDSRTSRHGSASSEHARGQRRRSAVARVENPLSHPSDRRPESRPIPKRHSKDSEVKTHSLFKVHRKPRKPPKESFLGMLCRPVESAGVVERPLRPLRPCKVSIPAGLRPGEVPEPLRARENWGISPVSEALSKADTDLFRRWMHAHKYGTATAEDLLGSPAAGGGGEVTYPVFSESSCSATRDTSRAPSSHTVALLSETSIFSFIGTLADAAPIDQPKTPDSRCLSEPASLAYTTAQSASDTSCSLAGNLEVGFDFLRSPSAFCFPIEMLSLLVTDSAAVTTTAVEVPEGETPLRKEWSPMENPIGSFTDLKNSIIFNDLGPSEDDVAMSSDRFSWERSGIYGMETTSTLALPSCPNLGASLLREQQSLGERESLYNWNVAERSCAGNTKPGEGSWGAPNHQKSSEVIPLMKDDVARRRPTSVQVVIRRARPTEERAASKRDVRDSDICPLGLAHAKREESSSLVACSVKSREPSEEQRRLFNQRSKEALTAVAFHNSNSSRESAVPEPGGVKPSREGAAWSQQSDDRMQSPWEHYDRALTLLIIENPRDPCCISEDKKRVVLPNKTLTEGEAPTTVTVHVDEAVAFHGEKEFVDVSLLKELAFQTTVGYNSVFFLSVAKGCGALGDRTIKTVLSMILKLLKQRLHDQQNSSGLGKTVTPAEDSSFKMELSIALFHRGRSVMDLIAFRDEKIGTLSPAPAVTNPMVSSWCDTLTLQNVGEEDQIADLLVPVEVWLRKDPEAVTRADETLGLYVLVRQASGLTEAVDKRNLHLSSLLIYVTRGASEQKPLFTRQIGCTSLQRSLFRRVGNGCLTVVASCVSQDCDDSITYAMDCSYARRIQSKLEKAGDVKQFMNSVASPTESYKPPTSVSQSGRLQITCHQCDPADMHMGMSSLLQNPDTSPVPFYPDGEAPHRDLMRGKVRTLPSKKDSLSLKSLRGPRPCRFDVPTVDEAMNMFNSGRIHAVALQDTNRNCGFRSKGGAGKTLLRISDHAMFNFDEVRPKRDAPGTPTHSVSATTSAMCTLFAEGCNCSLISLDGRGTPLVSSPAWDVIGDAIDTTFRRPGTTHRDVVICISVVTVEGMAVDMLQTAREPLMLAPFRIVTSPLSGPTISKATGCRIDSSSTLHELKYNVVKDAAPFWTEDAMLFVVLLNYFSTEDDVYLCSFSATITGSHDGVCRSLFTSRCNKNVMALHDWALRKSSATTFLISLDNEEDSQKGIAIATTLLSKVEKKKLRRESFKNCIYWNRKRQARWQAMLKENGDNAQLPSMNHQRSLHVLLECYEELLTDPRKYFPPSVRPTTEVNVPLSSTISQARPSILAPHTIRDLPVLTKNRKQTFPSLSAFAFSSRHHHPRWIVITEKNTLTRGFLSVIGTRPVMLQEREGCTITWHPTGEMFDIDELVDYKSDDSDIEQLFCLRSQSVRELVQNAMMGCNCAVLGILDESEDCDHVRSFPVWRVFSHLLSSVCFQAGSSRWKEGSEVHLRFCAVRGNELLMDFFAEDLMAPPNTPVRIGVMPVFGPVILNTTVMRALNLSECHFALHSALEKLNKVRSTYPSGAIIIASAVIKNVVTPDVKMSSLTAYVGRLGKDLPAVQSALNMSREGKVMQRLYSYFFSGPCHLLCITSLDPRNESRCCTMLRMIQALQHRRLPDVPSGSLMERLPLLKECLENDDIRDTLKRPLEQIVLEMERMLADPSLPVFVFPVNDDVQRRNGPLTQQTRPLADLQGNQLRPCVAIVTRMMGPKKYLRFRTDNNIIRAQGRTYQYSEVLARIKDSPNPQPEIINVISNRVLEGYNSTLVVADGTGSSIGAMVLLQLTCAVSRLCNASPDTTIFFSLVALRSAADGEIAVRDFLDQDGSFEKLVVAHSPLFGPCVDRAKFLFLKRLGDLGPTLRDAQQSCINSNAALVVLLVVKRVCAAENDLVMSSLMAVVNTTDGIGGPYASSFYTQMMDDLGIPAATSSPLSGSALSTTTTAEDSTGQQSLFRLCLGGPCLTHSITGLSPDADDAEQKALLDFGMRMKAMPYRLPPRSSARSLLQQADSMIAATPVSSSSSSRKLRHPADGLPWNWEVVKRDLESSLSSPSSLSSCTPQAYVYTAK